MQDDSSSSFAARLRELIGQDSVASFARKCGVGESLMRSYLSGSDPGRQNMEKIWRGSGCSLMWLMNGQGPKFLDDEAPPVRRLAPRTGESVPSQEVLEASDGRRFILVPRYDIRVSAGGGSVIHSEQIVDYYSFQAEWFAREVGIPPASAACVEVRGRSMEPDLFDKEIAVIDLSKNRFVDDGIYVLHYGDSLRIKKVNVGLDGTVQIRSSNEVDYPAETVTVEQAQFITIIARAKIAIPPIRRLP